MYTAPIPLSETELQRKLVSELHQGRFKSIFGNYIKVEEWPQWTNPTYDSNTGKDIPVILVFTRTKLFIIELKLREIGFKAFNQICNYLELPTVNAYSQRIRIQGVVIGHHISRNVDSALLEWANQRVGRFGPLRLLTYSQSEDDKILLSHAPHPYF